MSAEAILPAALASDPPPSASSGPAKACGVTVVDFDFANKVERSIEFGEAKAAFDAGRFVWGDIEASDPG